MGYARATITLHALINVPVTSFAVNCRSAFPFCDRGENVTASFRRSYVNFRSPRLSRLK